ncbi:hypothetical protein JXB22_08215 [candidate division WOR-3 bacterium]|nr:hypothetical protein [candidate division WOR-3 bacterium]
MKGMKQKREIRYYIDGKILSRRDIEITKYDKAGKKTYYQHENLERKTIMQNKYVYIGGRLRKERVFRSHGVLCYYIDYGYNGRQQLCYEKTTHADGKILSETFYKYNSKGRIEERFHGAYSMKDRFTDLYVYDHRGRLMYETSTSEMLGKEITAYAYDEQGKLREEYYTRNDQPVSRRTYIYDRKGKKERIDYFDYAEKRSGWSIVEETDRRGQPFYEKHYTENRLTSTDEYNYNEYGHMIRHYVRIYHCDCMGVRIIPFSLAEITYQYY